MPGTVVVGTQFGDEGKGKIVDVLAEEADLVVRFNGGANAGHTVQVGDDLYAFHLMPSGILRPRTVNVIAGGVVVEPGQLLAEIDEVERRGHPAKNLRISDRAHVVMPYHKILDGLEETLKGSLAAGSTRRGIAPVFEDKVGKWGLRMCDLVDPEILHERLSLVVPVKQRLIQAYGGTDVLDLEAIYTEYALYGKRLAPFVTDTSVLLEALLRRRKRILFEGAQGTLLCIDHGIYPFGTSSNCTAGAAATGAGISPRYLEKILGVAKAFTSRVGAGPFPTEQQDDVATHLRETGGGEYGTTTRRPRRVGWIDLVMLRAAVRVNGLTGLAVTKLDVLGGLDRVRVCTAYRHNGSTVKDFPASTKVLAEAEPVYRNFKGWPELSEDAWIRIAEKGRRALPDAVRRYLTFLESQLKVRVEIASVGRSRAATMTLRRYAAGASGASQGLEPLPELASLAEFVDGRLAATGTRSEFRGRPRGLDHGPQLVVAANDRVAGPGALRLQAVHDVLEPAALGPRRVRAFRVVERDLAEVRVEVDFEFRDHPERLEPRDEAGLNVLVRAEAREALDVPPRDIHEDRLGRVVEVEARREEVRADLRRFLVQRVPPEHAAVAAGDRPRVDLDDAVHLEPLRLLVRDDVMGDPELAAERAGGLEARRPVSRDALVDRDRLERDVGAASEVLMEKEEGRAAVLAAGEADRDLRRVAGQVELAADLLLHSVLDVLLEMRGAEVGAAVADEEDGELAAPVAGHGGVSGAPALYPSRISAAGSLAACTPAARERPWARARSSRTRRQPRSRPTLP